MEENYPSEVMAAIYCTIPSSKKDKLDFLNKIKEKISDFINEVNSDSDDGQPWISLEHELPPMGEVVMTKLHDSKGLRNVQFGVFKNRLFYFPHSYSTMAWSYSPTHWRRLSSQEKEQSNELLQDRCRSALEGCGVIVSGQKFKIVIDE